jgi:glycosyltransferase involved in cell wall biosynthesis
MKKVLIITYYWPPSGGGGVQRWLKMSKYLHLHGWEPVIYTPENPEFNVQDPSLQKDVRPEIEVLKTPIFEPIELFQSLFKVVGKKAPEQKDLLANRKSSLFQRFSTWLRGNVFIPDPRITWVRPSVKYLHQWLKNNHVDAVITTGPPHSMHLIGLGLKKKNPNLVWVADFRDPWTEWDIWPLLFTGKRAMKRMQKMERAVLTTANHVVSISPYHVNRLIALGAPKCTLVTNGYDEADFKSLQKIASNQFLIRHVGSIDDLRDPRPFIRCVKKIMLLNPEFASAFQMEFYGPVNSAFKSEIEADDLLRNKISFHSAVPHAEVVNLYVSSTLLLLVLAHTDIADGNTPGKMYEYMASKTPIFGIGPEKGDAAAILENTESGVMIDRLNEARIENALLHYFTIWQQQNLIEQPGAPSYSRSFLAGKIAEILNELTSK